MVPKRIRHEKCGTFFVDHGWSDYRHRQALCSACAAATKSTNGILRLCGIDPESDEEIVTEEDLLLMADAGRKKGTIDDSENDMIRNVFAFDDLTVGEICTHRKEVSILWMDETVAEWEQTIHESRHSVYPVCGDSVDQIIGVLNAKDFFRLNCRDKKSGHGTRSAYALFCPRESQGRPAVQQDETPCRSLCSSSGRIWRNVRNHYGNGFGGTAGR